MCVCYFETIIHETLILVLKMFTVYPLLQIFQPENLQKFFNTTRQSSLTYMYFTQHTTTLQTTGILYHPCTICSPKMIPPSYYANWKPLHTTHTCWTTCTRMLHVRRMLHIPHICTTLHVHYNTTHHLKVLYKVQRWVRMCGIPGDGWACISLTV